MRTVQVEELSAEGFLPFGYYTNLVNPATEKLMEPPIEFFRDPIQLDLNGRPASLSTCRVEPRDFVIDTTEYHTATAEGIMPIDNDALIHAGPASVPGEDPPLDKFRVFRVPLGTMVVLRPGVWHHAPFTPNARPANVLIILPERAYANDCAVVELKKDGQIQIEGV